ncbi:universal stress protein [uncultured Thiothrix sp.]|uniref:universal stress protein n=1 Tax=uncultured Thiothrix sp. TaxID=223185 RepID=UPI002613EF27|nr:universal stress protein [uncultured Thiothrix sp.]HMT94934.1 universal stress protein [Thiolinea sp.]
MFAYQHILVPIDFSPVSKRSINRAQELATQYQARLTILHIVEDVPLSVTAFGDVGAIYLTPASQEQQTNSDRVKLADLAQEMNLDASVKLEVVEGYPNSSITTYAEENQVDLIVIGHSAKHGLLGILMGSTAETVTKHAKCDVLVMRVPQTEAHEATTV